MRLITDAYPANVFSMFLLSISGLAVTLPFAWNSVFKIIFLFFHSVFIFICRPPWMFMHSAEVFMICVSRLAVYLNYMGLISVVHVLKKITSRIQPKVLHAYTKDDYTVT